MGAVAVSGCSKLPAADSKAVAKDAIVHAYFMVPPSTESGHSAGEMAPASRSIEVVA